MKKRQKKHCRRVRQGSNSDTAPVQQIRVIFETPPSVAPPAEVKVLAKNSTPPFKWNGAKPKRPLSETLKGPKLGSRMINARMRDSSGQEMSSQIEMLPISSRLKEEMRARAEHAKLWITYVSQTGLRREYKFTNAMIIAIGKPDIIQLNPYRRDGSMMRMYRRKRIERFLSIKRRQSPLMVSGCWRHVSEPVLAAPH